MATLDGIELLETSGALTSGAAFLLNSPAKVSRRVNVATWDLEVKNGGRYVVARSPTTS
jgi:hypothetical protein